MCVTVTLNFYIKCNIFMFNRGTVIISTISFRNNLNGNLCISIDELFQHIHITIHSGGGIASTHRKNNVVFHTFDLFKQWRFAK